MFACTDDEQKWIGYDEPRGMATRVEADVDVQRFGYAGDEKGRRLLFPHAHLREIEGNSGAMRYGGADCSFEPGN